MEPKAKEHYEHKSPCTFVLLQISSELPQAYPEVSSQWPSQRYFLNSWNLKLKQIRQKKNQFQEPWAAIWNHYFGATEPWIRNLRISLSVNLT